MDPQKAIEVLRYYYPEDDEEELIDATETAISALEKLMKEGSGNGRR